MIVVANLKMNLNYDECVNYNNVLSSYSSIHKIVICPSSPFLNVFNKTNFSIGSQNVYCEDEGAFTGEISVKQLKSLGVEYSIVGHSERRKIFNERDVEVNKKVLKLLEFGLKPIICVGEILEERTTGFTLEVIEKQLSICLYGVTDYSNIIVAYEPVWAIGTGLIPSLDEIKIVSDFINENYSGVQLLYGGSVDINNINSICKIDGIRGVLVGSASNDPSKFIDLIKTI